MPLRLIRLKAAIRSQIESRQMPTDYAAILMLCLLYSWMYSRDIDLYIAMRGFSPIDWVNHICLPANYIKDFPSGVENYRSSTFMYVYLLCYQYLGIRPETLLPVVIFLEIFALACAVFFMFRTLKPESHMLVGFVVVLNVISGYAGELNLARFETTFYKGLFYNIADALRIFSIASYLRNKFFASFLFIALSFVTHFVIGLIGIVFIAVLFVSAPKAIPKCKLITGLIIFAIISIGWLLKSVDISGMSAGGIPSHIWLDLTKMNNFHWYPIDYGTFSFNHQERFIPFLSFLLLLMFYFNRYSDNLKFQKKILSSILAMVVLVAFGVIVSTLSYPVLIKLSLHRASDMIIIIGLIYVVDGLFKELNSNSAYRCILSILILISPFVIRPGFSMIYSLLITVPAVLLEMNKKKIDLDTGYLIVIYILISFLFIYYFYAGFLLPFKTDAYTGLESYKSLVPAIFIITIVTLGRFRSLEISRTIAAFALLWLSCNWVLGQQMSSEDKKIASAYQQAQLWAKDHTPADTLFMIDPTIYYGWRDYSQRSSFGNLRDWLQNSWLYNSNYIIYHEGYNRFNEFGVPLQPYLNKTPPLNGFYELDRDIGKQYYELSDLWRLKMAKKYGINYFVFMKKKMRHGISLPIVFENDRFIIYSV
jgi:hypothetical protein